MNEFNPGDIVEILPQSGEKSALTRVGRVVLVTDGTNCLVTLNDGSAISVHASRLRKVGPRR